jgi:hypothetical protein
MKNLIYKELKLVLDPKIYIFSLLSGLIMIPNYPYMVGIAYFFLAVQIIFSTMKANKDLEFTALMPISRGSIVKSKYFTVIYLEAVQLVAAIPFALISSLLINKSGNPVGMDANFALFGSALISMSVFNAIFLPMYFKSGYKIAAPLIFGFTGFALAVIVLEFTIAFVPVLRNNLDSLSPATFGRQLIYLAAGLLVFAITPLLTFKKSVKAFERVNL